MKYNGTDWVYVGEQGFTPSSVEHPAMQVDGDGSVFVAFADNSAPTWRASVMRFKQPNTTHIEDIRTHTLNIYPNPSDGTFNVDVSGGKAQLTVHDMLGQQVLSQRVNGTHSFEIGEKGFYIVTIENDHGAKSAKVIVE